MDYSLSLLSRLSSSYYLVIHEHKYSIEAIVTVKNTVVVMREIFSVPVVFSHFSISKISLIELILSESIKNKAVDIK